MEAQVKIASCDFCYTKNKEYKPKILDTGDQFVFIQSTTTFDITMWEKSKTFLLFLTLRIIL